MPRDGTGPSDSTDGDALATMRAANADLESRLARAQVRLIESQSQVGRARAMSETCNASLIKVQEEKSSMEVAFHGLRLRLGELNDDMQSLDTL